MSYDFRLFLPQPEVDPIVTAQAAPDEDSEEINQGPPIPAKEARKKTVVDALVKADPSLEVFPFSFEEIAKLQNITVEEARNRFRHIELNCPEDGPGIQITLFDDEAFLTVPYWQKGTEASAVFAQIWAYLKLIQSITGYLIYDPQLECIVKLESDRERATKCYADVVEKVIG